MIYLNPYKLKDEITWRQERYDEAIKLVRATVARVFREVSDPTGERTGSMLREVTYDDGRIGGDHTHADQAGAVVHAINWGLANANLDSLTRDAAELASCHQAYRLVMQELDAMPVDLRAGLMSYWKVESEIEEQEKAAKLAADRAHRDSRCQAQVHDPGRAATIHQCQKKGSQTVTVDGVEYRACGTHVKNPPRRWGADDTPKKLNTATRRKPA